MRLPVADAAGRVAGYEMRFGAAGGPGEPIAAAGVNARATAAMVVDAFAGIGVDHVCGRHPAWLSLARDFLVAVGVPPVRPDRAVLQVAAYPAGDDLLAVLRRLRGMGYTLALTDYRGPEGVEPLLELCSVAKVAAGLAGLEAVAADVRARGLTLAVTGVDDAETLARCTALGVSWFQGDLLARPYAVRGRTTTSVGPEAMRALAELTRSDLTFEELERIVTRDVGLSLKLLGYVNSAFFSLPRTVDSVHQALALLGARPVQRWATVVILAGSPETPDELVALALQRGRLCEVLAETLSPDHRDAAFTLGLFSVADALLGMPMDDVLRTLPLSEETKAALLGHEGPRGRLLAAVLAWERGEFPELPEIAGPAFSAAYADAVHYGEQAVAVAA